MSVSLAHTVSSPVTRAVLYAFDAETGEELFSSKDLIDDWTHLSSITVVDASVYVTTRQSFVYAFGLQTRSPSK